MEMKIISQKKNPFLHREEFLLEICAEKNPGFSDVKKELGKNESLAVIKLIKGNFGRKLFRAEVVVYDSEENKNKIEKISRKARKKAAEEAKKAAEAAKAAGSA